MSQTHIFGRGARDIDPGLGEEGTGAEHEDDVNHSMEWMVHHMSQILRGAEVVTETPRGVRAGGAPSPHRLPRTEQVHNEVTSKPGRQHLWEERGRERK